MGVENLHESAPAPIVRPADNKVELRLGVEYPILMAAYVRWRAEGLFHLIFHKSPDMTMWQFLDWNYSHGVEPVGCFIGDNLVGIGWICQAYEIDGGQVVGEVGAAFFHGTPLSVWHRALDLFMRHAFVDRGFSTIYGLSAANNVAAREILRYCGMHPADRLPWGQEVSEDTVIFKMARSEWKGLV